MMQMVSIWTKKFLPRLILCNITFIQSKKGINTNHNAVTGLKKLFSADDKYMQAQATKNPRNDEPLSPKKHAFFHPPHPNCKQENQKYLQMQSQKHNLQRPIL